MFGIYRKLVKTFMKLFCVYSNFSCVVFYSEYTSYCCCKKKNKGNGGNNNRSSNGVESTNGNNNGSKKDDKKVGPKKVLEKGKSNVDPKINQKVNPKKVEPEKVPVEDKSKVDPKINEDDLKKIEAFRKKFNLPKDDFSDIRLLNVLKKDDDGDFEKAFSYLYEDN